MLIYALAVIVADKREPFDEFHSAAQWEKFGKYRILCKENYTYDNHFKHALSSKENYSVLMMRKCIESTKEAIDRNFAKG